MAVLLEITKLNEVEYVMFMDLKLLNITIGICSLSSRHPCPYGECFKDKDGNWIKGRDRTIGNIREHRTKWMKRSRNKKGNRNNLKEHFNCEFDPLVNVNPDESVIKVIPPPAFHTILLGPVNHVFKELKKSFKKL